MFNSTSASQDRRSVTAEEPQPRALGDLAGYVRILVRWRWLALGCVILSLVAGFVLTAMQTRLYTASTTIQIDRATSKVVNVEGVERDAGVNDIEFYQTQYGLLRARSLAEKVATNLHLDRDPKFFEESGVEIPQARAGVSPAALRDQRLKAAAGMLLARISISPVRSSRLVDVSYTSANRERAAQVANGWANGFIEETMERRFDSTAYARKFLEGKLNELRQQLEEAERRVVGYAANERLITLGATTDEKGNQTGERSLASENLAAFNVELAKASAARIEVESRMRQNGGAREIVSNATISNLRAQRAAVAAEYKQMMAQFEPSYPPARALEGRLATIDQAIGAEESRVRGALQAEYRQAVAREEALKQRVESLTGGVIDRERRSIQYGIYKRDADTTRELYNSLLQRYQQIGVTGDVGASNVMVIDPARVPSGPSHPRLTFNLGLALFAGLLLAALLIFVLEQLIQKIVDPADVQRELGLPLLGAVPVAPEGDVLKVLSDRKSPLFEAYFSVVASLQFSTDHGAPRSLLVTSTQPGEGKSTTAFAISQTFARTNKRVLIVDADLRSPSLHHILEVPNVAGLSNFLTGNDDIDQLIIPTGVEGLSAMVTGPMPPNAAELLSGHRLAQLIEKLLTRFDHVIVDAPPVLGLADAPMLSSAVEATLFVAQSNGARLSSVTTALSRLVAVRGHIAGVVLTKFNPKSASLYGGYEYSYSYGSH